MATEEELAKAAVARHESHLASLEFEREGYVRRGLTDRAKQVEDVIKAAKKSAPAKVEEVDEPEPVAVDEQRTAVESSPRTNRH